MKKLLLLVLFLPLLIISITSPVRAEECVASFFTCSDENDCRDKIAKCREAYEAMEKAKQPHEENLRRMEANIAGFQTRIKQIEQELKLKASEIAHSEETFDQREEILAKRVRQSYIRSYYNTPLVVLFSQKSATQALRELGYQKVLANDDKRVIIETVLYIKDLEMRKQELENEKQRLANLKAETDRLAEQVRKLLAEATVYQQKVENIISSLTAKQQEILRGKAETFQISVGEVPPADDPASRPDYNPGFSPAFAAFSFGAPHRKGMSQYGAYGRAKSGQSAEDILHAYYGGLEIKKDFSTDINITVDGYGTVDLETYTKRIYEVPNQWGDEGGMEALKAQAVAARSYALAYTNNGAGSICATESCQVYKPQNKGGKWEEAVNATRGWVLLTNGKPFSAWYAASSGGYNFSYTSNGYTTSGGWDTKCGSRNCWTNEAFEKIASSPWFYKAWYRERSGESCGRSHPWLTQDEFTDILNAWIVLTKGTGEDQNHISPVDTGCWGGDPYSLEKMRQRAADLGGAYSDVSSISVDYSSDGFTNSVKLQTNLGEVSISGSDFKTIFNLRSPGKISLKSSLFNIEKK